MIKLKNAQQIEAIRKSGVILASLLKDIKDQIAPGVSLLELDAWAYDYILSRGATPAFKGYMGFPGTLCTSVNEQVIHGIPTQRKLEEGDLLSVDCGVNLEGYISDSAYTFAVGKITPMEEQLLLDTQKSLEVGIKAASEGKRIKDISRAISNFLSPLGYGIVSQYCGHGVGIDVHEEPQVPNVLSSGPNPRLKPGMVLAIEPMVNLGTPDVSVLKDDWTVVTNDGKRSAHFEHTIAITASGIEILTIG